MLIQNEFNFNWKQKQLILEYIDYFNHFKSYFHAQYNIGFIYYDGEYVTRDIYKSIYYFPLGHGTTVADLDKDEDDGYVFEDSTMIDDILIQHLIDKKKNESSKLTFATDACHTGSIWDIHGGNVKR